MARPLGVVPDVVVILKTFSFGVVRVPVKVGLVLGARQASSSKMLVPSTTRS